MNKLQALLLIFGWFLLGIAYGDVIKKFASNEVFHICSIKEQP